MSDLFSYSQGKALRDRGIAQVISFPSDDYVLQAQAVALNLAYKNGEVSSDDLQRILSRPINLSPNVIGAVFSSLIKSKKLKLLTFKQSERVSARARRIAVYGPY